jgi:hypothetical protein
MTEPKLTPAEARARAHTLAMFLAGYGFGLAKSLMALLPPELCALHEADFKQFRKNVEKLQELNALGEAPDAT